jgi:glycosyltransferase involved in cell wall biosynthesis
LAVGHLREEKDPRTLWAAMRLLADRPDVKLDHLGRALDPALGTGAEALAQALPTTYRWLGDRPHAEVRRRLARAHVLVHPSRMEGGAHAVIEALRSGTPVLASRIDGNLGLLGRDWPAVFEPGDATGLAAWLRRLRDTPRLWAELAALAAQRGADFAPDHERAALHALVARALSATL